MESNVNEMYFTEVGNPPDCSVRLQSEDRKSLSAAADPPSVPAAEALKPEADHAESQSSPIMSGDRGHPCAPQLHTDPTLPPKTPSSVSLAESMQSASHSESSRSTAALHTNRLYKV